MTSIARKAMLMTVALLAVAALVAPSALAVSGVNMSGDASAAQYPKVESLSQSPGQETLDQNASGGGGSPGEQPQTVGGGGSGGGGAAQKLPFTGYLAGGVLLLGFALLSGGYALRRPLSA